MSTPPDDSDLRDLLGDAVSEVHPQLGPEHVRERADRPSATRWVPLTVGAAAATVLVIGGAGWFAQHQPGAPTASGPAASSPAATPSPSAGASQAAAPTRTVTVPVYYVGDTAAGRRLFTEQRRVTGTSATELQVAVDEAIGGRPLDPDYDRWPVLGLTARATTDGQAVTIDLSGLDGAQPDLGETDSALALQALVWTADAVTKSTLPVRFLVDGQAPDTLLGNDVSSPVPPVSADSVLAPVQITSPAQGATVPTHFTVTGQASTFEANVVWELKQGQQTVQNGYTTAQECCTLSPYSFNLDAPPGDYTLVVHDTDESDGEGFGISQDTREITVQ